MGLPSVTYKIVRAQEHLQTFESEAARYYQTNPAKVVRQSEGAPDQYVGRVVTEGPIPARFPIILGDFLQNLRSSLDYLVWELVLAAKNTPGKHNMFPICPTPQAFQDAVSKQRRISGIAPDAVTIIERLQPYNCGDFKQSVLWFIDDLCNINKHRRVLLTRMHGGIAPEGTETKIVDGQAWFKTDIAKIQDDAKIGPFPIVNGPLGTGVQVPMNLHIMAFIAFDEGTAKGKHVTAMLGGVLHYVYEEVIPLFGEFFG
jgi:hypothetical protein